MSKNKIISGKPSSNNGASHKQQELINTLRVDMRKKRRSLTTAEQQEAATQFAYHFCRSAIYRYSRHLACYLATDGEINLLPVIERAWRDNKTVYLPVLHPFANKLQFAAYTSDTVLVNNRFAIGEPAVAAAARANPINMDVVLTPLVAFDRNGNRIGMGGGFYDRSFAFLKRRKIWLRPLLIGCAHGIQQLDNIQSQSWDLPLAGVFTDKGRI